MEDNKPKNQSNNPLQKLHLVVIFFCFVAGFLGAGVFWLTVGGGLSYENPIVTSDQQKIVSVEGDVIASTYKNTVPSVVSITTEAITGNGLFSAVSEGAGTGLVLSKDGYVITNKHVVKGARNITLVDSDGTVYKDVDYLGEDPLNDVAFLKIQNLKKDLKPAVLADSSKVAVGQKVVAIGNALGQYQNSITSGIISGRGRPVIAQDGPASEQLDNLFQTDAAINPGNSGGPLLNLDGEVIAINTAIARDAEGVGFAIPINATKGLIKTLTTTGKVKKAYLGLQYLNITPQVAETFKLPVKKGAYVYTNQGNAIIAGAPADNAGIKLKDIITKVDGQAIDESNSLALLLGLHAPKDEVTLTVLRGGSQRTIKVTLGDYQPS